MSRWYELVYVYKYLMLFIEYIIERCLRLNRKWVLFFNCYFNNSDGVLNFCKNCDLDFIESIIKVNCVIYYGLVGIVGI